jgi:hypothetical protein
MYENSQIWRIPMIYKAKSATLLAFSVALLGTMCVPSRAYAECTAATIANNYGFHFDGLVGPTSTAALKVPAFVQEAVVGEISFTATSDTGGTLSGSESGTFGGLPFQTTFTGTYTVNAPKCTGSLSRTLSINGFTGTADFVIVKAGEEVEFVDTSAGLVEQGVMKKE